MKWFIFIVVLLVILGFVSNQAGQSVLAFKDTSVMCLPNGHTNIGAHIHPILNIFVDGEPELISPNMGIEGSCMAEVHTHDSTGTIHIETVDPAAANSFAFSSFLEVSELSLNREGYSLEVLVDNEVYEGDVQNLIMNDNQNIVLNYTSSE